VILAPFLAFVPDNGFKLVFCLNLRQTQIGFPWPPPGLLGIFFCFLRTRALQVPLLATEKWRDSGGVGEIVGKGQAGSSAHGRFNRRQAGSSVQGRLFSFLFTFQHLFTCWAGNGGCTAPLTRNDLGAAVRAQPGQHSYVWLPRGIPHREAQGQPAVPRFNWNPLAIRARTGQVVHAHHHSLIAPSALGRARPQARAGRKSIHRGTVCVGRCGRQVPCVVPPAGAPKGVLGAGAGGQLAMQSPPRGG